MKIITILGTRPELIRLSLLIKELDKYTNHFIVHTGQNYDYELDKIFFEELNIREPNFFLKAKGTFSEQLSIIFPKLEKIILDIKPDKFLVLGDTNSSMGAIVAKRLGIPVFHLEAGNRCHDQIVPEEVNRKIIDHSSSILMPYTENSKKNLLLEGLENKNIYVVGNPINEVINKHITKINTSRILEKLKLKINEFVLITLHREENVDDKDVITEITNAIGFLANKYKKLNFVWPIHPRTKKRLTDYKIKSLNEKNIHLIKPLGFIDFCNLEKNAKIILTDSGTVQEECAIFKKNCLIVRNTTERPEVIESGAAILTGTKKNNITNNFDCILNEKPKVTSPIEYQYLNFTRIVSNILLGNNLGK